MAGRVGVKITKDVGGGLRGSTSGLRFNPREAPEFAEEDRNYGRDDPKGKQEEDERKRREKEHRHRKIAGLQHVTIKPKGKGRTKPEGDRKRNDEELSEMTGPVSSTGYPLDVATGAKTGGGSAMGGPNIMTGVSMDSILDDIILKKKGKKDSSKPLTPDPPLAGFGLGEKGKKKREREETTETQKFGKKARRKRKGLLRVLGRRPERHSKESYVSKKPLLQAPRAGGMSGGLMQRRFRGIGRPKFTWSPWERARDIFHQAAQRFQPRSEIAAQIGGIGPMKNPNLSGRGPATRVHQAATRQPRTTSTPGGAAATTGSNIGTGASPIAPAGGPIQSVKNLMSSIGRSLGGPSGGTPQMAKAEELLEKGTLTHADLTELKMLIRELRKVLGSGNFRKAGLEDSEHDDERPTPNAHRKTTSSPTGATDIDPDDDPRYWGAHPMGLLLPRRGHM